MHSQKTRQTAEDPGLPPWNGSEQEEEDDEEEEGGGGSGEAGCLKVPKRTRERERRRLVGAVDGRETGGNDVGPGGPT